MSTEPRIRPVIILPKGEISKADIKKLCDNGFCTIEAKDPSKVRFAEPPPTGYSQQEQAAIKLCRHIVEKGNSGHTTQWNYATLSQLLVYFFTHGTPLLPVPETTKTKSV